MTDAATGERLHPEDEQAGPLGRGDTERAMSERICRTPVLLLIHKRPDLTRRVFDAIREARPGELFVVADGPRQDRPGEAAACAAARRITEEVDWDCRVHRNYADTNMGCRDRVSSGITRVFEQVESAIILEDDCVPHPDFFPFCTELLRYHRDNERVMMITGTNVAGKWKADSQSYHFALYGSVWGWATWRRAWLHYDVNMSAWADPGVRAAVRELVASPTAYRRRRLLFDKSMRGEIDTWDIQWNFAQLRRSAWAAVPSANLVSNIGFGAGAAHTGRPGAPLSRLPSFENPLPIRHPASPSLDREYDRLYLKATAPGAGKRRGLLGRLRAIPHRIVNGIARADDLVRFLLRARRR